jgi:hypothetical protein
MLLAVGVDIKVGARPWVCVIRTHGRLYVTVLEEMGEATAAALAAFVPRKGKREAAG